eukprot:Amastigsp_a676681_878.p3 type:complete len:123 gc:universal Amastigsp_a676681_878:359-727(+)
MLRTVSLRARLSTWTLAIALRCRSSRRWSCIPSTSSALRRRRRSFCQSSRPASSSAASGSRSRTTALTQARWRQRPRRSMVASGSLSRGPRLGSRTRLLRTLPWCGPRPRTARFAGSFSSAA